MMNRPLMFLGIAAMVAQGALLTGCSSGGNSTGTGGSSGGSTGGNINGGTGGSGGTGGAAPADGGGMVGVNGSCDGTTNPDVDTCWGPAANPKSGVACTVDCCVPCGIDASGSKVCNCGPAGVYANCSCLPPSSFPVGLTGGPCMPAGASAAAAADTLKGKPCTKTNTVCFTSDSTATSERGCICMADGIMHCGSVNHWFTNNNVPTTYN